MSDFDDDFMADDLNEFDSGDVSNDNPTSTEHSMSELDAVADLLMGGDGKGHRPKSNDSGFRSRDIDQHGKIDHSTNSREQEEPSYAGNQSAPDMQSAQARVDHYEAQGRAIQSKWEDLQAMKGDLTPEQFNYQQQFLQGQAAAAVMQQQQAQIELMQNQQWLAGEEAKVREKHADIFNDPTKREMYGRKMVDYLGKIGYSREELSDMGAREYNAVLDMVKLQEERDALKLQVAKYKAEHRKRNQSLKQGRRDIETGAGRSKKGGGDVYDEVARILGGTK